MKKVCFFILLLSYCHVFGQWHDNIWASGNKNRNVKLNFEENTPQLTLKNFNCGLNNSNLIFSDSTGNLLFYSNGLQVFNKNSTIMENGNSLADDYLTHNFNYEDTGYPFVKGMTAIYKPGSHNEIYIIYQNFFDGINPMKVVYSVVDISFNSVCPFSQSIK
jgi:hypothetical protein